VQQKQQALEVFHLLAVESYFDWVDFQMVDFRFEVAVLSAGLYFECYFHKWKFYLIVLLLLVEESWCNGLNH
jgi:hypothetical protein